MDFTVLIVGLFIGIGIPLRNKAIKEYRKKGNKDGKLQNPTADKLFAGNSPEMLSGISGEFL